MFSFTISATFPLSYCFYSLFCSLSLFLQSIFIVYLCGSSFCSVLSSYVFTVYLSTTLYFPSLSSTSYLSSSKFHLLRGRHKLYKSCGDPPIFRRFLFFGIGRSPPDFLDLEPCRKGQATDVCRPPPGDCSAIARFVPQMT